MKNEELRSSFEVQYAQIQQELLDSRQQSRVLTENIQELTINKVIKNL